MVTLLTLVIYTVRWPRRAIPNRMRLIYFQNVISNLVISKLDISKVDISKVDISTLCTYMRMRSMAQKVASCDRHGASRDPLSPVHDPICVFCYTTQRSWPGSYVAT